MKPIVLSTAAWDKLLLQLHKDYPMSVLAIRDKMVRVLGCSYRHHLGWKDNPTYTTEMIEYEKIKHDKMTFVLFPPSKGDYIQRVYLDFYSEQKQTFFLLKYSEFIHTRD